MAIRPPSAFAQDNGHYGQTAFISEGFGFRPGAAFLNPKQLQGSTATGGQRLCLSLTIVIETSRASSCWPVSCDNEFFSIRHFFE